jgi:chromosome segregation ATPase
MRTSTRVAAAIASATLVLGPIAAVTQSAQAAEPEPCAQQQTQVDRAEDALARVTAVFERAKAKVARAKAHLENADNGTEKAQARRALARAKADLAAARKAKKAQVERLAKAQARLDECLAAQPAPAA